MVKDRIKGYLCAYTKVFRSHPTEIVMIIAVTVLSILGLEHRVYSENGEFVNRAFLSIEKGVFFYFLSCLMGTIVLHTLYRRTKSVILKYGYYLSFLTIIPFAFLPMEGVSTTWIITMVLTFLAYLLVDSKRDNEEYVRTFIHYLEALLYAGALALLSMLLLFSIVGSIEYIFNVKHLENFYQYGACVSGFFLFPTFFLMFSSEKPIFDIIQSRVMDLLVNYVFSITLIIYTFITYLYIAKILVDWSLPKGGVSYIVLCYIGVMTIIQGVRAILQRQRFNYFFRNSQYILLPTVLLMWVALFYRVHQYGWTEARIYLMLLDLVATLIVGMGFSKKYGRYLYMTWILFIPLLLITYIKPVSANQLGVYSQRHRVEKAVESLGILREGVLTQKSQLPQTEAVDQYQRMLGGLLYLVNQNDTIYARQHYGVKSSQDVFNAIPKEYLAYMEEESGIMWSQTNNVYLDWIDDGSKKESLVRDIKGYKQLIWGSRYKGEQIVQLSGQDSLKIKVSGVTEVHLSQSQWIKQKLQEVGLTIDSPADSISAHSDRLLLFENDQVLILFENLSLRGDHITQVECELVLVK